MSEGFTCLIIPNTLLLIWSSRQSLTLELQSWYTSLKTQVKYKNFVSLKDIMSLCRILGVDHINSSECFQKAMLRLNNREVTVVGCPSDSDAMTLWL